MNTETRYEGVFPILATPFLPDESIDIESCARLVKFMHRVGCNGVTVLGVLGEANRMLDRERESVIRAAVTAAGGMPVIVGASHPGTQATVDLAHMAQELGATAVMVTPSAEPVPNEQRVFEYFQRIAADLRIGLVVQDHPASTGVHMSVALLARIVDELPAVVCIKEEATPTPPKITQLRQAMRRPLPILTGLGALYGGFDLERGSAGFNTGFAFPEVLQAMVSATKAGDRARAQALYQRFLPLIVFEQQPGVAVRKEILRRRGLIAHATVRHPGAGLGPGVGEQLDRLLDDCLADTDLTAPLRMG